MKRKKKLNAGSFNLRLFLGTQKEIEDKCNNKEGSRFDYQRLIKCRLYFDKNNTGFISLCYDENIGYFYIDISSKMLGDLQERILSKVKFVTVEVNMSIAGGFGPGEFKKGEICLVSAGNILSGRHNDPFALRDFVQDILDRKVAPVEDGQEESLTIAEVQAKLDVVEKEIEQIKFALEHAETEKAEAVQAVQDELRMLKRNLNDEYGKILKVDQIAKWLVRPWSFPFISKTRVNSMIRKHVWFPSYED